MSSELSKDATRRQLQQDRGSQKVRIEGSWRPGTILRKNSCDRLSSNGAFVARLLVLNIAVCRLIAVEYPF
jgi:hypothetical protein